MDEERDFARSSATRLGATDASSALSDFDQRYRTLVDHSPDAICVHEAGRVVYVNPAGLRWIAAESADDVIGKPITAFVHPDSIPPMLSRISALRNEGDSSEPSEALFMRFDGRTIDVEAVSVLTEWEGRPAFQVVFRDITAQRAAEETLRFQAALVTHVSDGIIATTTDGVVTSWNPAAEAIYGRTADTVLGRPVSEAVGAPLDPAAIATRGGVTHANHIATDGTARTVRISAGQMDDGYVLVSTDQTALRRAESHFKTVVTSLDEGVVVIDSTGRIESANPAARRIFEPRVPDGARAGDPNDAMAYPIFDSAGRRIRPEDNPITVVLRTGRAYTNHVFGFDRVDGTRVWLSGSCVLLNPDDRQHSAIVVSFSDITEQRAASDRLAYEANHDSLTGLPNRAHIVGRMASALTSPGAQAISAVFFIDLDRLKFVNDSLGHIAGDQVLQIAGDRLRRAVRSDDAIGRLGGDEFVALLCGSADTVDLDRLAERLHNTLAEPITIQGQILHIGASIGIVVVAENDPRSADDILCDADIAMYEAKKSDHGRTRYFTLDLREQMRLRLERDQAALSERGTWDSRQETH